MPVGSAVGTLFFRVHKSFRHEVLYRPRVWLRVWRRARREARASVGRLCLTNPILLSSIMQAAVTEYFRVWNAHDEQGIKALHATASTLTDWDAAHGALSALLWHTRRPSLAASPSPALLPAPSPAPHASSC